MNNNKELKQKVQVGTDTAKEISRATAKKMGFIAMLISQLRIEFVIKSYAIGFVGFMVVILGVAYAQLPGGYIIYGGVNFVLTPLSFIIYNDIKYLYYKKRGVRTTVTVYIKGSDYYNRKFLKKYLIFMLYLFLYISGILLAPLGLIYLYFGYKRDLKKFNKSRI